jgi:hypothetical protein
MGPIVLKQPVFLLQNTAVPVTTLHFHENVVIEARNLSQNGAVLYSMQSVIIVSRIIRCRNKIYICCTAIYVNPPSPRFKISK